MPRRPVHPGASNGIWARIGTMLSDPRTWTTLAYLLLMLPLGIIYFVIAFVGISLGGALIVAPFLKIAQHLGWIVINHPSSVDSVLFGSLVGSLFATACGVLICTALLHAARGIGRGQVALARALLVKP